MKANPIPGKGRVITVSQNSNSFGVNYTSQLLQRLLGFILPCTKYSGRLTTPVSIIIHR
jgi:hypothetical protein